MSLQFILTSTISRRVFLTLGAGVCSVLVLLVGILAANPSWHEVLHEHVHASSGKGCNHDHHSSDDSEQGACAVCALARQQVNLGWLNPIRSAVPDSSFETEFPVREGVEGEWRRVEPSGRGPPAQA